jgi:hypothetical protein
LVAELRITTSRDPDGDERVHGRGARAGAAVVVGHRGGGVPTEHAAAGHDRRVRGS